MNGTLSTIVIGAPATGSKFWPRIDMTEALLAGLQNDHVIFPGPRRTGKTSILLNLKDTSSEQKRAVLINAEKYSNPKELIQGIAKEVMTPGLEKKFPTSDPNQRADFSFVLNVLKHDGYLIQETQNEQRTRFASNLLRDFWSRQHA